MHVTRQAGSMWAAGRIDVVIPYFGYARQDRRFKQGESVSARALARAITADRVFTINVHNRGVLQHADFDYIEKTRLSGDDVAIKTKKLDVAGKDVVILDDIISTGGTIVKTSDLLRENGADRVYVACIHPVLARNAATRIFSAGIEGIMATDTLDREGIMATDTLDRSVSVISVAQLIADAI
jgi:ribose-phosphate pyrophosphokinase